MIFSQVVSEIGLFGSLFPFRKIVDPIGHLALGHPGHPGPSHKTAAKLAAVRTKTWSSSVSVGQFGTQMLEFIL